MKKYNEERVVETTNVNVYEYTIHELKERYMSFVNDYRKDMVQDAIQSIRNGHNDLALNCLESIPTKNFDDFDLQDFKCGMNFSALFWEVVQDHHDLIRQTTSSTKWLERNYIKIVDTLSSNILADCDVPKYTFSVKEAEW